MVKEQGLNLGGGHTIQYTGDVSYNYTLETYIVLLTNGTPITLIRKRKREPLYSVGGIEDWCSHQEKNYEDSSKIKIELPYDPAILLLGIQLKKSKTLIQKVMHSYVHCSIIYNSKAIKATCVYNKING